MSIKNIIFLALILVSFRPTLTEAKTFFDSGRSLTQYCQVASGYFKNNKSILDNPNGLMCIGYFQGVLDIVLNNNGAGSCIPANVTMDQLIRVFLNYSERNPERSDQAALILLFESFHEKYPCKEK